MRPSRSNPPPTIVRTPLYEAKVDPDIYFFGFDLTIAEAKGGTGQNPNDDPGWFFVIKERPGEPRFGLELDPTVPTRPSTRSAGTRLPVGGGGFPARRCLAPAALSAAGGDRSRIDQHHDDDIVNGAAASAARWAYLLFRAPVLVAVHADELLG